MNYDEVKQLALSYADRSDVATTSRINDFIRMAEARINRLLKTRKQTGRAYTLAEKHKDRYTLPPDYIGLRTINYTLKVPTGGESTVSEMLYLTPRQLTNLGETRSSAVYYTIVDDQFQIHPKLDDGYTIEIVYYRKVPTLSESAPANWMSEGHPDIYVSAIAAEISLFVKDYEAMNMWAARLAEAINELDNTDAEERWTASTLTMRTE